MTNHKLDQISGWVFAALGVWVTYGAWIMPRFEERGASLFEAPGLTPGLLGVTLTIFGLILALRPAMRDGAATEFWDTIVGTAANRNRALAALGLTLGYGAVLFGNLAFVPATAIFLFAFIVVFEVVLPASQATDKSRPVWQSLTIAAVIAVVFSTAIFWIFSQVFLVQLP